MTITHPDRKCLSEMRNLLLPGDTERSGADLNKPSLLRPTSAGPGSAQQVLPPSPIYCPRPLRLPVLSPPDLWWGRGSGTAWRRRKRSHAARSRRVTNVRLVRLFGGTSTLDWSDWNVGFIGVVLFALFVAAFHSGRNVLKAVIRPEQRTGPAPPRDAKNQETPVRDVNNKTTHFISNLYLTWSVKRARRSFSRRPDGTFSNCGRKLEYRHAHTRNYKLHT